VNNTTPPDLTATYSATYKAPACGSGGKSCDSGAALLNGRGTMTNGVETNHPNTINNSCIDGNSGTYHVDESIDRMKVATNDGSAFASGKAVTITFTTYCYGSADKLDVYYTANAASPSWTSLGTQTCTTAGVKTFTATYTLPSGANQAVRGNFRYNGSASACTNGSYNDHDDLVFGVQ
jgi:leucyl aminopeptidase